MGECNGTNLKPIAPILFFKQVFENRGVLVLRPDCWRERPRSTSTLRGANVLIFLAYPMEVLFCLYNLRKYSETLLRQLWKILTSWPDEGGKDLTKVSLKLC